MNKFQKVAELKGYADDVIDILNQLQKKGFEVVDDDENECCKKTWHILKIVETT